MIRQLFLPDKINNYYLFSKRIVGLDIGKTHISATLVHVKGKKNTIEKYVEEKIELTLNNSYVERATKALQLVMDQIGNYDEIRVALSSSTAIFKEIKLPFLSYEKIKVVVNYEIEPLLPFSINDSVVDFIITKQFPADQSSQVLVAAVQKPHIALLLEILAGAKISPDIITIDLFALYSLYTQIPTYAHIQGNVVLIDLGVQTTRVAYIQAGQMRFIRTLNKGILHLAKEVSESLGMQPNEAMEYIIRYGFEKTTNQQYLQAISESLNSFWQEIQFTLQSFIIQGTQDRIAKIILLGGGSEIKKIADFASSLLGTPVELMHIADILQNPNLGIANKISLPSSSIISLATAIPSETTDQFNLRQGEFATTKQDLLNKQIIVAIGLLTLLMGILSLHVFFQIRKFSNEAHASQQDAINALKERPNFNAALEDGLKSVKKENERLPRAVEIAQEEIKKQEETWFAFAGPYRATMLKDLLELSKRIDKESLGFEIQSLQISNDTITIRASVKNHEALQTLEKELKESKLFSYVSSPEETTFTMKITLAKNGEE